MADAVLGIAKRKLTVDTVTWTPSPLAPFTGSYFAVKNTDGVNGFKVRTDATDANTEDSIPVNSQDSISAGAIKPRFLKGSVVGYYQVAAGTGPLLFTFVK